LERRKPNAAVGFRWGRAIHVRALKGHHAELKRVLRGRRGGPHELVNGRGIISSKVGQWVRVARERNAQQDAILVHFDIVDRLPEKATANATGSNGCAAGRIVRHFVPMKVQIQFNRCSNFVAVLFLFLLLLFLLLPLLLLLVWIINRMQWIKMHTVCMYVYIDYNTVVMTTNWHCCFIEKHARKTCSKQREVDYIFIGALSQERLARHSHSCSLKSPIAIIVVIKKYMVLEYRST
jgi:hypothetical protein